MAPKSLDPQADTVVCIIQTGPVSFKKTKFKVLAAALSASPYWQSFIRHMDGSSGFQPNDTHIEDTGITVAAVEIFFWVLHLSHRQINSDGSTNNTKSKLEEKGLDSANHAPISTNVRREVDDPLPEVHDPVDLSHTEMKLPPELLRANTDDVWGLLALLNLDCDGKKHQGKFGVDVHVFRPWFLKWFETAVTIFKTKEDFEKVLFPTFAFRHPKGFRLTAKWLCQNTSVGNIEEYNPMVHMHKTQWYLHLHLPKDLISWVRIARSKLRTDVSNAIWSIIRGGKGWLSDAKCDCWIVAQYNYLQGLVKAGVLCPELDRRKTVMELAELMKTAEYEEPLDPCLKCSKANITSHLRSAIRVALDCEAAFGRELPCAIERRAEEISEATLSKRTGLNGI